MLLVGIIIFLLWLFQIIFLEQFYTVLETGAIKKNAKKIVYEIQTLTELEQMTTTQEISNQIEEFILKNQISVEVIDAKYHILYQGASGNTLSMPGMMRESLSEMAKETLAGMETEREVSHPKFGYGFLVMGIPIFDAEVVEGAMILVMPIAAIEETVSILKVQLILITAILLFISLFVSYKLSKNLAHPILAISRQAESYAQGKYDVRNNAVHEDELGILADRMNHMGVALAENEKLQKELIGNVSHELRTPLTLIRGYAETLRDVTGENKQKRERQLGVIIEESERLGNIVGDMLNLSRLQAGAINFIEEEFSLKEMLNLIKEHYESGVEEKRLQFVGGMEKEEHLLGDQEKLQQVFFNLIDNALRHSDKGTPVVITTISTKESIQIEVKDYGEGILAEDLPHIFERYYIGKQEEQKHKSGTGLGLAIVKSILELHNAEFGVTSERGVGSVFWFRLKKANAHTSF